MNNLYNKETSEKGKYINNKGSIVSKCGVAISDFIEVPTNGVSISDRGVVTGTNKEVHTIATYNPDKEFIQHIFVTDKYIPDHNYKFIRLNMGETTIEDIEVLPL